MAPTSPPHSNSTPAEEARIAVLSDEASRDHLATIASKLAENQIRWKNYQRRPSEYLLIATEELGEVARAMQKNCLGYQWPPAYNQDVYDELVDLAAVVLGMMLECEAAL